jgi:hypothetical protein
MIGRTNYQKKFSAFRDKPVRRSGSTKWLEDELDAIVRLILPLLESNCFTCGATKDLQVGHLTERRHVYASVRRKSIRRSSGKGAQPAENHVLGSRGIAGRERSATTSIAG